MLFRLTSNGQDGRPHTTHSGVLEFTAEEGCCYIPYWMMQNLLLEEGALLTVTNVSLPKAVFVKLQPQSVDFLEISNPRAVLEHALRNFSCVTTGDIIQIPYNEKNYHFALKEVKPADAACIIETDCNVDFDAPVGYKEPTMSGSSHEAATSAASSTPVGSEAPSEQGDNEEDDEDKPAGLRIVNGEIVRPDDSATTTSTPEMLAPRTGQTGVQSNAAIPQKAPAVEYWAMAAGEGSRLDGKAPAPLEKSDGTALNVRELQAQARAAAAEKRRSALADAVGGRSLAGNEVAASTNGSNSTIETPSAAAKPQRKSRVGSKYSKLKQSSVAFHGTANSTNN